MTAGGMIRSLGVITAAAMIINLILNLLLIPSLACTGAAVAALITQVFVAIVCTIVVHRKKVTLFNWRRVIPFILTFALVLAIGLIFKYLDMSWMLTAALQLILGTIMALILRLIEPMKGIKLLMQKE